MCDSLSLALSLSRSLSLALSLSLSLSLSLDFSLARSFSLYNPIPPVEACAGTSTSTNCEAAS